MKRIIYFFVLLMMSSSLLAQRIISIGEGADLHSKVLNENRSYWVHLPDSYNQVGNEKYPVIYLLDGENNFHSLVGIQKSLTRGMYNYMPECIIVGVLNVDRNRDFTPTNSFVERDGKKTMTTSGGAKSFLSFLTDELRVEVDSKYRTSGYNILIGHSLGGLFAINTLLHHTDSFNAYISLDPSLWWDNQKLYNEASEKWATKDFSGRSLFVGMAQVVKRAHDTDKREHSNTISDFCENVLIPHSSVNQLYGNWRYYENETHGSVTTIGMLDGLRMFFDGMALPVKQVPKNPNLIKDTFDKLSKQLGFPFTPSQSLLERLSNYAESVGETENAQKILEIK